MKKSYKFLFLTSTLLLNHTQSTNEFDFVSCHDITKFVVRNNIISSVRYLRVWADNSRLGSLRMIIGTAPLLIIRPGARGGIFGSCTPKSLLELLQARIVSRKKIKDPVPLECISGPVLPRNSACAPQA